MRKNGLTEERGLEGDREEDRDAPERVEEQQSHEDTGQAEDESDKPPPEGDKPEGNEEEGSGEGQESSGQPPDPPDPPDPQDPDDPDPNPDEEEEEEGEENEEDQGDGEVGDQEGREEEGEKETDGPEQLVESESTKKKRKIVAERQEKVNEAAMTRLPYNLPEKRPLYKGVMIVPKDLPDKSTQWGVVRGAIPKPKDKTPINHQGNRAFENIRNCQGTQHCTLEQYVDSMWMLTMALFGSRLQGQECKRKTASLA